MSQQEQGKKTSPAEKLPAGKDDKAPVPGKPAALSDADLDNVAGGTAGSEVIGTAPSKPWSAWTAGKPRS